MNYEILQWDTSFFGFVTAKILHHDLDNDALSSILSDMRGRNIRLVYWASGKMLADSEVKKLGGLLVDTKTTYVVDLKSVSQDKTTLLFGVEPYASFIPISDMEALAIESGKYSRFFVDPHFDSEQSRKLFKKWIRKSINKKNVGSVLVIRDNENVVGMVACACNNGQGDIDLLAVDPEFRGKKYGESLVRAAQAWFIDKGLKVGQVITQGDNVPACKLYERCNYRRGKIEYYYHFWL